MGTSVLAAFAFLQATRSSVIDADDPHKLATFLLSRSNEAKRAFQSATSHPRPVPPNRGARLYQMEVPDQIEGAQLICFTVLDERHVPTGETRHSVDGELIANFSRLAICQYPGMEGEFYLFYCDGDWNVLTDTCHQSLDDAKSQAAFEHEGMADTWEAP